MKPNSKSLLESSNLRTYNALPQYQQLFSAIPHMPLACAPSPTKLQSRDDLSFENVNSAQDLKKKSQTLFDAYTKAKAKGGYNFGSAELESRLGDVLVPAIFSQSKPFAYGDKTASYGHSERIGMRDLLDKHITNLRNASKSPLPYDRTKSLSEDNIRRPSSPHPNDNQLAQLLTTQGFQKKDIGFLGSDYPKNFSYPPDTLLPLYRLTDPANQEIYKNFLENSAARVNMFSERPNCDYNSEKYGGNCSDFVNGIFPFDSRMISLPSSEETELKKNIKLFRPNTRSPSSSHSNERQRSRELSREKKLLTQRQKSYQSFPTQQGIMVSRLPLDPDKRRRELETFEKEREARAQREDAEKTAAWEKDRKKQNEKAEQMAQWFRDNCNL